MQHSKLSTVSKSSLTIYNIDKSPLVKVVTHGSKGVYTWKCMLQLDNYFNHFNKCKLIIFSKDIYGVFGLFIYLAILFQRNIHIALGKLFAITFYYENTLM